VSSEVTARVMALIGLGLVRPTAVGFCLVGVRNGLGGDDEGYMGRGEEAPVSEGVGTEGVDTKWVLSLSVLYQRLVSMLTDSGQSTGNSRNIPFSH
jgi:hypothetical protein